MRVPLPIISRNLLMSVSVIHMGSGYRYAYDPLSPDTLFGGSTLFSHLCSGVRHIYIFTMLHTVHVCSLFGQSSSREKDGPRTTEDHWSASEDKHLKTGGKGGKKARKR